MRFQFDDKGALDAVAERLERDALRLGVAPDARAVLDAALTELITTEFNAVELDATETDSGVVEEESR